MAAAVLDGGTKGALGAEVAIAHAEGFAAGDGTTELENVLEEKDAKLTALMSQTMQAMQAMQSELSELTSAIASIKAAADDELDGVVTPTVGHQVATGPLY